MTNTNRDLFSSPQRLVHVPNPQPMDDWIARVNSAPCVGEKGAQKAVTRAKKESTIMLGSAIRGVCSKVDVTRVTHRPRTVQPSLLAVVRHECTDYELGDYSHLGRANFNVRRDAYTVFSKELVTRWQNSHRWNVPTTRKFSLCLLDVGHMGGFNDLTQRTVPVVPCITGFFRFDEFEDTQTIFNLPGHSSLCATVETVCGDLWRTINAVGLAPDMELFRKKLSDAIARKRVEHKA